MYFSFFSISALVAHFVGLLGELLHFVIFIYIDALFNVLEFPNSVIGFLKSGQYKLKPYNDIALKYSKLF